MIYTYITYIHVADRLNISHTNEITKFKKKDRLNEIRTLFESIVWKTEIIECNAWLSADFLFNIFSR